MNKELLKKLQETLDKHVSERKKKAQEEEGDKEAMMLTMFLQGVEAIVSAIEELKEEIKHGKQ